MKLANQHITENILVVDDTPANLHLLATLLGDKNFKVRAAISGEAALTAIAKSAPDLILLDACMPKMDGFTVCRQLKAQNETRDIPVIFISALNATEDKVKAFAAGGVDYVTKPFQIEEVLARVNAHLNSNRLQRALADQNQKLDEMVRQQTKELVAANSKLSILNKAKSDFLTLISHELRTPLNGVLGAADLAFGEFPADPLFADFQEMYETSRRRLMGLLDDALLFADIQLKSGEFAGNALVLDEVLAEVQTEVVNFAKPLGVEIGPFPKDLGRVVGERLFLKKALYCLLETAVKFSSSGGTVRLQAQLEPHEINLTIEAAAHSIPEADLPWFFDVLAIAKTLTPGGDLGLAPALAERIITLFGGRVEVRNRQPAGIQLQAWLPRQLESTDRPAAENPPGQPG